MAYTMLKGRNHLKVYSGKPRPRRAHHKAIPPLDVGIIPGNRFLLLPLKGVSKFLRHRCNGSSATSTRTSIVKKSTRISRSAVCHIGTPTIRTRTGNIGHCENDLNLCRSTVSSPRKSTKRVNMKQRRIPHPIFVKTTLSPVSEKAHLEQEENLIENVQFPGYVRSWNVYETPVYSQEKDTELRNVDGQVLGLNKQVNRGAKNLQKNYNLVCKAKTRPKTICGNSGCKYLSASRELNQRRNSPRYGNPDAVGNKSFKHDILAMFRDASKLRSMAGCIYNTCNDEFVQQNTNSKGRQISCSSALERIQDVPRGVKESRYISPVMVELKPRNRSKKPTTSRIFSEMILLSSGFNKIKCKNSAGCIKYLSKPKGATIKETNLGQLPQLSKQQIVRKRLEEAIKRVLFNRTCRSHGGPMRNTSIIIFDQLAASSDYLLEEPGEEEFKGWFDANTASEDSDQTAQGQSAQEAASEERQERRSEQCRVVAQPRQRPRKKLRNTLPRIQTSERNRARSSSKPVRHGIIRNISIGHQLPPSTHTSTNNAQLAGELGRYKVKKPAVHRHGDEQVALPAATVLGNSHTWNQTCSNGIHCPSSGENELPIGPLHPPLHPRLF